jgi:hypothetical protein
MMDEEGDQKDKTQGKSDLLNIDSIEIWDDYNQPLNLN